MIDNPVFPGFLAIHKIVSIGVLLYPIHILARVQFQNFVQGVLHSKDLPGLDLDIGSLPLESTHGLMDEDS